MNMNEFRWTNLSLHKMRDIGNWCHCCCCITVGFPYCNLVTYKGNLFNQEDSVYIWFGSMQGKVKGYESIESLANPKHILVSFHTACLIVMLYLLFGLQVLQQLLQCQHLSTSLGHRQSTVRSKVMHFNVVLTQCNASWEILQSPPPQKK